MNSKEVAETFINHTTPYIKKSAEKAANTFDSMGLKFEIFEGTSMQLSSFDCENIYKDLIRSSITNQVLCSINCGLFAVVAPVKESETQITLNVQLGVVF